MTVDVASSRRSRSRDAKVGDEGGAARRLDAAGPEAPRSSSSANTPDMVEFFSRRWAIRIPGTSTTRWCSATSPARWRRRPPRDSRESQLRRAAIPPDSLSGLRARLADLHVRGRRGPRARAPLVRRPRDLPLARLDLAQRVLRDLLAHDVEREGARRRRPDVSALGVSRHGTSTTCARPAASGRWSTSATRNRPRCTRRRRRT